ncbi:MAG: aminotransferase class IV [Opitutaceae bacterium]
MANAETSDRASPAATVYCNGELLLASAARLPIDDAGVLFGLGFFETFRTSGGRPHHWPFHRARLEQACRMAGIEIPPNFLGRDDGRLREVVAVLLREHGASEGVFRYTLTAGRASEVTTGPTFTRPGEVLTFRAFPSTAPREGISLRVLQLARDNGEWLPRPKSLNYANAFAGAEELRRRTDIASDEGLFLSREERWLVETARQNIAWMADGKLCYPDPTLGAVSGTCLSWALQCGLPVTPRRAKLDELRAAEAVIVLNAVRGVTPVRELWDQDDRVRLQRYSSWEHPLVMELQQRWSDALLATARS